MASIIFADELQKVVRCEETVYDVCLIKNLTINVKFNLKIINIEKYKSLKLDNSTIKYFPINIFTDYKHLKLISCINCKLEKFQIKEKFTFESAIENMYLNFNKLSKIDAHTMAQFPLLRHLDLGFNPLTPIWGNIFSSNINLIYLQLSLAKIEILSENTFKNCNKLSIIYLNLNNIKELPYNLFKFNPNLKQVDLSSNQIEYLEKQLFRYSHKLISVDISGNKIKHLPFDLSQFIASHGNVKKFFISDNNWTCQSLISYVNLFRKYKIAYKKWSEKSFSDTNYDGISCVHSREL